MSEKDASTPLDGAAGGENDTFNSPPTSDPKKRSVSGDSGEESDSKRQRVENVENVENEGELAEDHDAMEVDEDDDLMAGMEDEEQLQFLAGHLESLLEGETETEKEKDKETEDKQASQEPTPPISSAVAPAPPPDEPYTQTQTIAEAVAQAAAQKQKQKQKTSSSSVSRPKSPEPPQRKLRLAYSPNKALTILNSLPLLDNLSTQILTQLTNHSFDETINMLSDVESENCQIFDSLLTLFETTKRIYGDETFLTSPNLHQVCRSDAQKTVLQRVNLTTFVCGVLGALEIGFFDLNDYFLDSFVGHNGRLFKMLGSLFLELKTQAYILSLDNKDELEKPLETILDELFPANMEKRLSQRPAAEARGGLTQHEVGFGDRCKNRHDYLKEKSSAESLADEYPYKTFASNVHDYIAKHVDTMTTKETMAVVEPAKQNVVVAQKPRPETVTQHKAGSYHVWNLSSDRRAKAQPPKTFASRVATSTPGRMINRTPAQAMLAGRQQQQQQQQQQHKQRQQPVQQAQSGNAITQQTAQTKNASTAETYQAARASSSKFYQDIAPIQTNAHNGGRHFLRNTWSKEEEAALMNGLDKVQGPHWAQILEYYGPGGSVSEVLKNRTQVQLKDKARNLKLFFIKNNLELPRVLNFVSGDARRGGRRAKPALKTQNPPVRTTALPSSSVANSHNSRPSATPAPAGSPLPHGATTTHTTSQPLSQPQVPAAVSVSKPTPTPMPTNNTTVQSQQTDSAIDPALGGMGGEVDPSLGQEHPSSARSEQQAATTAAATSEASAAQDTATASSSSAVATRDTNTVTTTTATTHAADDEDATPTESQPQDDPNIDGSGAADEEDLEQLMQSVAGLIDGDEDLDLDDGGDELGGSHDAADGDKNEGEKPAETA